MEPSLLSFTVGIVGLLLGIQSMAFLILLRSMRKLSLLIVNIRMSMTKLNHDSVQPMPSKVIKQVSISLDLYLSAWTDAALPSLWLPPHSAVSRVILMWWLEVPLQLLQWLSMMIWVTIF
jgi:hypothetical protein